MKHQLDNHNAIKKIFDAVVEEYPDDFDFVVRNANFIFTFRDKPMYDDEGNPIAAQAKSVSNRERDLYGTDFEICVFEELWDTLTEKGKKRLVYHELMHCRVEPSEDSEDEPSYDNDGRVVTYIEPHDLIIKTFKREIEVFGLQQMDVDVARFMSVHYKKYREAKKK